MKPRILFHVFAVLVLVAAVAAAQSTPQKAKPASNGQHDRESSAPSVSEVTLSKSAPSNGQKDRESSAPSVSEVTLSKSAPSNGQKDRESSAPSVSEVTLSKPTDRKSGSVIVLDRDAASGQASGREASTGLPSGKRQHDPVKVDGSISADQQTSLNSKNSGHATESLNADQKPKAQSNPMYKDNANRGENPLFEGKDKAAAKPSDSGSKSKTVEYKDGEDQTSRTRPGNNKPSK